MAKRAPKAEPLPGMENMRIRPLDKVAAAISEVREQMNELRGTEKELLGEALTLMRKHEKTSWNHAGVEMARIPGQEHLRVRTSNKKATAEVEEPEDSEALEHQFDTEPNGEVRQ
jgi:hypothetical protein